MKKTLILLFAALIIVLACKKTNNESKPATLKVTLVSPNDGSTVTRTEVTQFSWTASSSNSTAPMGYKIQIVEIKGDQSPDNALHTNKPIFEKDSGNWVGANPSINYPFSARHPAFTAKAKYAWQVTARQEGVAAEAASAASTFTASE